MLQDYFLEKRLFASGHAVSEHEHPITIFQGLANGDGHTHSLDNCLLCCLPRKRIPQMPSYTEGKKLVQRKHRGEHSCPLWSFLWPCFRTSIRLVKCTNLLVKLLNHACPWLQRTMLSFHSETPPYLS